MLLDRYKEIFEFDNGKKWKYYSGLPIHDNPFEHDFSAEFFIHEYFNTAGKKDVLDENIKWTKFRNIHSISTFFLGIHLKEICKVSHLKPDFRYLWFITCLYHDYGYYFEDEKTKFPPKEQTLTALMKIQKIKHNLLESGSYNADCRETILKYYDFCRNEKCFINHGIVGGIMLYDKLIKNYFENKEKARDKGINVETDDFDYNDLHWDIEHKAYYKQASDSIISHNIWCANSKKDKKLYRIYKLENLIINPKDEKRSCSTDPFLFLLLLADTLEPIKAFPDVSYKCLLKMIDIEPIENTKIAITVSDNCLNYQGWFDKIKDLKNWLKVKVDQPEQHNKLVIEIK